MTADAATDPAVRVFIDAINEGDRDAFFAVLTPDATMSDDGTDRDLAQWVDREIFNANGHMDVESVGDDGRSLIANIAMTHTGPCGLRGASWSQKDVSADSKRARPEFMLSSPSRWSST